MKRLSVIIFALALVAVACGGGSEAVTADAGADYSLPVGETPQFDGCSSTPADTITGFTWEILEGPSPDAAQMLNEASPDCGFDLGAAMVETDIGDWVIQLTVTDGETTSTDTVTITVTE